MWNSKFAPTKFADFLLNTYPIWVTPAYIFTLVSLVYGMNYSWVGLIIASM